MPCTKKCPLHFFFGSKPGRVHFSGVLREAAERAAGGAVERLGGGELWGREGLGEFGGGGERAEAAGSAQPLVRAVAQGAFWEIGLGLKGGGG